MRDGGSHALVALKDYRSGVRSAASGVWRAASDVWRAACDVPHIRAEGQLACAIENCGEGRPDFAMREATVEFS